MTLQHSEQRFAPSLNAQRPTPGADPSRCARRVRSSSTPIEWHAAVHIRRRIEQNRFHGVPIKRDAMARICVSGPVCLSKIVRHTHTCFSARPFHAGWEQHVATGGWQSSSRVCRHEPDLLDVVLHGAVVDGVAVGHHEPAPPPPLPQPAENHRARGTGHGARGTRHGPGPRAKRHEARGARREPSIIWTRAWATSTHRSTSHGVMPKSQASFGQETTQEPTVIHPSGGQGQGSICMRASHHSACDGQGQGSIVSQLLRSAGVCWRASFAK